MTTERTNAGHQLPEPVYLTAEDMSDYARGAAFLGSGGGGDPYIGRLIAENAIRHHGSPRLIQLRDLSDDDMVFPISMLGAPTVVVEKALHGDEANIVIDALEEMLDCKATAIMAAEIGGLNAMLPIQAAARRGLPLVDADGMGRAFPEVQMATFNIMGVSASPMAIANERGETVLIRAHDAERMEALARTVCVQMGLSVMTCHYVMTGAEAKRASVPHTLSASLAIGRAIRYGREHSDPMTALLKCLRASPYYNHCGILFSGKVVDLMRRTQAGFAVGHCHLEEFDSSGRMEVRFQNEFLQAKRNGVTVAIVPDLICMVDYETGEPVTTEGLKFGQRLSVIGASAVPMLRQPAALPVVGPSAFGLEEPFVPIEELNALG